VDLAGEPHLRDGWCPGSIRARHRQGGPALARGDSWSGEDRAAFEAPIREQYEHQGEPYYATARLWDDGIVDPAQTRDLLGLALDVVSRSPLPEPRFGVFRM
jgi:3-methylcrotonyl-CoA carboxylase beta subunit